MTMPILSVCLITYNHEKYIRESIESVLIQKVDFTWEIIIADDYSSDCTREIVLEYHRKFPDLIRLLFQAENVGAGRNFVDLINSANGKYIAYLEGDDYWTDKFKLQKQFEFMQKNQNYSMCYHQIKWVYTFNEPDGKNEHLQISNVTDDETTSIEYLIKNGWYIRSCSMFFIKIKLTDDFSELYVGDYPLHVLLADKGQIGFIQECMAVYRVHLHGISGKSLNSQNVDIVCKNFEAKIIMYTFLNRETRYDHNKLFSINIFNVIFDYLFFLAKRCDYLILKKTVKYICQFGPYFFIKYGSYKFSNKFQRTFIN
jgi:glycosyltransferase involved in cell wall biosynthesis